jgi:MFS transporter, FHS family, L-fucose permease
VRLTGIAQKHASRYLLAFAATMCLFATWGLAHRISGIVSPQFYAFFAFSPLQATLAQSGFGLSYLLLAIPATLFLRRLGYKLGLVAGLCAFSLGAFLLYPSFAQNQPLFFLAAIVVSGIGWAFLETSANPLIVAMGPPETAVRRLNLAQCFYPAGQLAGAWLGSVLTLPKVYAADVHFVEAVVRPYVMVGLGVLLLAFLIENVEFPPVAVERSGKGRRARDEFRSLLAQPIFRLALAAIAACIAALVCIWGVMEPYAAQAVPDLLKSMPMPLTLSLWLACGSGRIAGTVLMYRFDPAKLMLVFCGACLGCTALAGATVGGIGIVFLLAASFFISIMFPTIFAGTIRGLGDLTKPASGLLVMAAGFGGLAGMAVIRLALAFQAVHAAMAAAAVSLAIVLAYAWCRLREEKHATVAPV